MPEYRKSDGTVVEHKATKYDGFKLVKTEHPYRHQKGSGRSRCFELAQDGMLIGTWTKKCAEEGYDSRFVVGSLIKLAGTANPGWVFSETDNKGQTLADVKKVRDVDPAKAAERSAKAKAAADAKKAKAAAKTTAKKSTGAGRGKKKAA